MPVYLPKKSFHAERITHKNLNVLFASISIAMTKRSNISLSLKYIRVIFVHKRVGNLTADKMKLSTRTDSDLMLNNIYAIPDSMAFFY